MYHSSLKWKSAILFASPLYYQVTTVFFCEYAKTVFTQQILRDSQKKKKLYSPSFQEATWAVLAMPEVKQQSQKKKEKH